MRVLTVNQIKELKANKEIYHMAWRRDYGDGMDTDDTVLWINHTPTTCIISGLSSQCRCAYMDDKRVGFYYNTNKEVKELISEKLGF